MKTFKKYIQDLLGKNSSLQVFALSGCIEKRILEIQTLAARFRPQEFSIPARRSGGRFPSENTRTDSWFGFNLSRAVGVLLLAIFTSCTDVVDVEVQNGPERLVIEASLDWEKGTSGNAQTVRLRKSTQFFDTNSVTDVTGASVMVTNDTSGASVTFVDQNNGEYQTNSFQPVLGQSYTLRVEYNGEVYTAQETMTPVTDITNVFQDREDGFDDEALEVHVVFTDPPGDENQYLFRFQREGDLLPDLEAAEDEFVDGNEIDWWYEIDDDDDLEPFAPGDVLSIEMFGISRPYYDYIKILIDQLGGVGLFEAIPVAVRGNCINTTNPENYAFGYFRLTQVVRTQYTFVEDEQSTNAE